MTNADRRLDALTTGLTARERAILAIGLWNRGEEPDDRLIAVGRALLRRQVCRRSIKSFDGGGAVA